MKLGVIADDFTGASDIALTLSEGGMRCVQYVGVPDAAAGQEVDAGIVSLKSRTAPAEEAVAQSLAACDWLLRQGARQIVFKVCSTFDSTPHGNIGPVGMALAERLGEKVVIVCPAFPENGRTVYQGHLFVGDRLLNESGMQEHPLTPMTDPDLRRVLAAQTDWPVAHVAAPVVARGGAAVAAALPAGPVMVIADATEDAHLRALAEAARGRRLVVGGSGIALGLPATVGVQPGAADWAGVAGPGAVISGSCSRATREQVRRYRDRAPGREVTAEALVAGEVDPAAIADWAVAQDKPPLVYTSADPADVAAAQARFGRDDLAGVIDRFFSDLTRALMDRGVTRLLVAGGETAGAAVLGLGARAFEIGPRIAAGVPILRPEGRAIALVLKSGNFGGPDFFAEGLERMARP